ncbi:hypothetical protein B9Z19DRAFT_1091481 [Tuber borchii]|uniref:Uncharacterized protein n=1 Tax=Tuber borchii TaxID=42251 RepID=A0A2T6ZHF0_TUBBO|nr:hypothetical protein B9Z19DRAFT_1091481 [Tuber borchii]
MARFLWRIREYHTSDISCGMFAGTIGVRGLLKLFEEVQDGCPMKWLKGGTYI